MCDRIAFDFCFEVSAEGEVRIFPWNDGADEIEVSYRIAGSTIQVAPWTVGVDSQEGYLVGYQLDGYPAVLEPITMLYELVWLII